MAVMFAFLIFILFTNPSARAGYDTRSIFNQSLTGLNSEFYFSLTSCLTKAEEPSVSYYLPIAGGRTFGFIPFPRVLVLCEMQSVSSRIWTRIAVSISYDDDHYTTGPYSYVRLSRSLASSFFRFHGSKTQRDFIKRVSFLLVFYFGFSVLGSLVKGQDSEYHGFSWPFRASLRWGTNLFLIYTFYVWNRSIWKLFAFDKNIWNLIIACQYMIIHKLKSCNEKENRKH